jgi:hypothetical protein
MLVVVVVVGCCRQHIRVHAGHSNWQGRVQQSRILVGEVKVSDLGI